MEEQIRATEAYKEHGERIEKVETGLEIAKEEFAERFDKGTKRMAHIEDKVDKVEDKVDQLSDLFKQHNTDVLNAINDVKIEVKDDKLRELRTELKENRAEKIKDEDKAFSWKQGTVLLILAGIISVVGAIVVPILTK